jgi:hypothetical protein
VPLKQLLAPTALRRNTCGIVSSLLDVASRGVRGSAPSRAALVRASAAAAVSATSSQALRALADAREFAGGDLSDDLAVGAIRKT